MSRLLVIVLALALAAPVADARSYRDPQQRRSFTSANPCPSTGRSGGACPGYQVDHRTPLYVGGADHPSNMQWLSVEQHRTKTQSERRSGVYGPYWQKNWSRP